MAIAFNTTIRNALLSSLVSQAGTSALLRLYSGTRPSSGAAVGGGNTLLAELTCNGSSFGSVSSGVLTLGSVTQDSSANATGVATWARLVQSDGSTWVADFTVTATGGGGDITMASTTITSGLPVLTSGTLTITAGNA